MYLKPFLAGLFIIIARLGNSQPSGGTVHGWFNCAEFISSSSPPPLYLDTNFFILQYDSGCHWLDEHGYTQSLPIFAAGHIFDLTHELWSWVKGTPAFPIHPFASGDAFVWDSLRFNYFYLRGNADTGITDTLFIYYYCNFDDKDVQIAASTMAYGMKDTLKIASPLPFNYTELSGSRYFKKDTVLLKYGDTAGIKNRHPYRSSVNRAFNSTSATGDNSGRLFGYSLTFKPGFNNVVGDTLFDLRDSSARANIFGVYYSEFATSAIGLDSPYITKLYSDNSLWLIKNNRYGDSLGGKPGFTPGWQFYDPKTLHGAAFVTGKSTVSAKEINVAGLKLFPNPVSAGELFTIETGNQLPRQAIIIITDMLGRQVGSGVVNPSGVNNYTINAPLSEGVYTITIVDASSGSWLGGTRLLVAR